MQNCLKFRQLIIACDRTVDIATMNSNVNEYLTIHLSTKINEITIVMKCRTIKFLKCKCAKLTDFYQTYSNVTLTSFFLSKPASLTENVQDFTGRNILCHIKSYVL